MKVSVTNRFSSGWMQTSRDEVAVSQKWRPQISKTIDKFWVWSQVEYETYVQSILWGKCCFGSTTQLVIQKMNRAKCVLNPSNPFFCLEEPTYSEKVQIIKNTIHRFENIVLEVFPSETTLVDDVNLYHIWVVEKAKFPFSGIQPVSSIKEQDWKNVRVDNLDFEFWLDKKDEVVCLYLRRKDGKELTWKEKQRLKNVLQGEETTAVEIVSKHGVNKPTCILCLGEDYTLDFGLQFL